MIISLHRKSTKPPSVAADLQKCVPRRLMIHLQRYAFLTKNETCKSFLQKKNNNISNPLRTS